MKIQITFDSNNDVRVSNAVTWLLGNHNLFEAMPLMASNQIYSCHMEFGSKVMGLLADFLEKNELMLSKFVERCCDFLDTLRKSGEFAELEELGKELDRQISAARSDMSCTEQVTNKVA